MKILLRITIVLAVIIIGTVAFKAGYSHYTWHNLEQAQTGVFTKPPATLPPTTTTEPTTQAAADTELVPPEKYIIQTLDNTTGTPVGSTVEKADFENSVFIGDSVSLGFSRYCMRNGKLKDTNFLTVGSYSVASALSMDMSANKGFSHPMYNGKETPLKTALEEIKPKNAFICLGINDVAIYGVDGTVKNYCKLINMIRKINPEVHVYVVSTTLMVDNAQGRNLRNIGIINLNHNMKQLCETNENLDYIDIMSALQSEDFALSGSYCSDGYIHQSNSAYKIWLEKLGVE